MSLPDTGHAHAIAALIAACSSVGGTKAAANCGGVVEDELNKRPYTLKKIAPSSFMPHLVGEIAHRARTANALSASEAATNELTPVVGERAYRQTLRG